MLGAVAPTPMRARLAEKAIKGKKIDEAIIEACAQDTADEARPRAESIRASPEHKKMITKLFTMRAIKEAIAE